MSKAVVVAAEVSATPGTVTYPPAVSGVWAPGSVVETSDPKLTVQGKAALNAAECTFSFNGLDSNGVTVTGSSTVQLNPSPTVLQGAGGDLLLTGDSMQDSFGNRLLAVAAGNLTTD